MFQPLNQPKAWSMRCCARLDYNLSNLSFDGWVNILIPTFFDALKLFMPFACTFINYVE